MKNRLKNRIKTRRAVFGRGDQAVVMKISLVTLAVNLLLSVFKLLAGIFAHSEAMISDAVHSASDVGSTVIVMVGAVAAGKASDREHPYGHERLECVASILLAVLLFATGIGIGWQGCLSISGILSGSYESPEAPGLLALIAAVVSIGTKEWMYWYTRAGAKRIGSGALMADAWHHRSDALSSLGAFIGILGARLGFPVLDPAVSVLIALLIVKVAVSIFRDAVDQVVDKACDEKTVGKIREVILAQEGVLQIDLLQTRMFGTKIYVDVEIGADGSRPLSETHSIAETVHGAIEAQFPQVKHCMIHVNPCLVEAKPEPTVEEPQSPEAEGEKGGGSN